MVIFIGIAYLVSWSMWLFIILAGETNQYLFWLAGFGPTISAILLTAFTQGFSGVKRLFYLGWRVRPFWYFISLLGTPLVMLVSLGLHVMMGADTPQFIDPNHMVTSLDQWLLIIVVFAYIFIFTALGEEIGWRAYLLPRLQKSFSPFISSLLLGLVWALWHLPLFWMSENFHQQLPLSWFLLQILGSTFIYTWIFNRTQGSLLIALLFHTSSNAAVGLLPILPLDNNDSIRPLWLTVVILWLLVGLVLWLERRKFFGQEITDLIDFLKR
jgi:membrane protease YdiL (CAAX protease family)